MAKPSIIQGREIQVGDVIRSAAMRTMATVTAAYPSSTGNTMEVSFLAGPDYRIGMGSKVKLYSRPSN